MQPSGNIFFQDEWEQFYEVMWETIGDTIDITSIIKQPYVWGAVPEGFVKNGVLYKKGIITTTRQVIRTFNGGYTIVAEGTSQIVDYIQMNYPCGGGPSDRFKYHLDHSISDEIDMVATDGPHWADPSESDDVVWGDLNNDGSPANDLTGTYADNVLQWIDVWN